MSFLPYGNGSAAGWAGAFAGSAAAHVVILAGVLHLYGGAFLNGSEAAEPPGFTVSFEQIDVGSVAPVTELPAEEEAYSGEPEVLQPEAVEPEEVAAVEPELVEPELPGAEDPGTLEPEVPETLVPETVTAIPAQELSPILPTETIAVAAAPPVEVVAPNVTLPPAQTGAGGAASAPAPVAAPAPSQQDLALGALIDRLRGTSGDPCLIALPRRQGTEGVGLGLVAATDAAMDSFARALADGGGTVPDQTRVLVDPRQCPALDWIRQNADYPATRLGLRVDASEVASGGRLTGIIRGGAGRQLTLLLIDDNGVVQDLGRFLSFSGALAQFDVPVTRDGPARDTSQILVAIGTTRSPRALTDRAGYLSDEVFSGLVGELADGAWLAVATFDVR